jgi:hypothetical protein
VIWVGCVCDLQVCGLDDRAHGPKNMRKELTQEACAPTTGSVTRFTVGFQKISLHKKGEVFRLIHSFLKIHQYSNETHRQDGDTLISLDLLNKMTGQKLHCCSCDFCYYLSISRNLQNLHIPVYVRQRQETIMLTHLPTK